MARGKGKPFVKGNQAGIGHGRPPLPIELKQARALNRAEFERVANRFLHMTFAELQAAREAPATTALERIIIAVISGAITDGDHARLGFLLDRLIGKVTEPVQTHHHLNLSLMPRSQVIAIGQEALAFLKASHHEDE